MGLAEYNNALARAANAAPRVGRATWLMARVKGRSLAAKSISDSMYSTHLSYELR